MDKTLARLAGWKGYALAATLALAIGFGAGWTVRDWKAGADATAAAKRETKQVVRVIERERDQADVTSEVEARATETQVQIRTVTQTIIKEVPIYVPAEADARFALPAGLVRVHDAAATGQPLSEPSGEPDDAARNLEASDIAPSWLAATIAENYGTCHADQARLGDLQDWVRRQQAVTNAP